MSEDAPAPAKVAEFSIGLPNEIIEPSAVSVVSSAGAGLAFDGFILVQKYLYLWAQILCLSTSICTLIR